ncbi:hypothetical protein DNTS_008761, partial [Danionella cerebrum]
EFSCLCFRTCMSSAKVPVNDEDSSELQLCVWNQPLLHPAWSELAAGLGHPPGTLCSLRAGETQSRPLSPALRAVIWTLLSFGILLSLVFLVFSLRFRNNRIVKMSSPNLNILTLCGSLLTYSSGFLFAMEENSHPTVGGSRPFLQARIWILCIGSSLVFGPILGKTWRLHRVFSQRAPDKRVIIRDIHLMGLVTLIVLVDLLVLSTWVMVDPIKCSRSVSATMKVIDKDNSLSVTQLDACSCFYSELWVILICILKGTLLLYGTYLAGLTSSVSLPPVNQSSTIMVAVGLVSMSSAVAVPVSLYLSAWPNLIYSVVSGAIFICTMAINCLLFIPQLMQWRRFEEENNPNPVRMAKYFSSPSRSTNSMYSEDEIYDLLGENDSMKRLISEKNAVIDSLQEQVTNAKSKLLKLMRDGQFLDEREMDITKLHSNSTQTSAIYSDSTKGLLNKCSDVPVTKSLSPPPYIPPPPIPMQSTTNQMCTEGPGTTEASQYPPQPRLQDVSYHEVPRITEDADGTVFHSGNLDKLHENLDQEIFAECSPSEPLATAMLPIVPPTGHMGFVTSEQLVEILKDLTTDPVSNSFKSSNHSMSPSISSEELSPQSSLKLILPTISPTVMRKRRPQLYSSRGGLSPHSITCSVPMALQKTQLELEQFRKGEPNTSNGQRHVLWEERMEKNKKDHWKCSSHKCYDLTKKVCDPASSRLTEGLKCSDEPYDNSDIDSSSSEDSKSPFCKFCHHPCDYTDSLGSGTSDSEDEDFYPSSQPVVNFNVDLKPTFV